MKSGIVDYRIISTEKTAYFYGANGESGFTLTPDEGVKEINVDRALIIKGGPGTGKSTLMKRFADLAKSKGYENTYYYCSSDPSSLDCVICDLSGKRIALYDGTAPHVKEAEYPGAVSEIFDISPFWNGAGLREKKDEILYLNDRKKRLFESAYGFLRASGELRKSLKKISALSVDIDKIKRFAERFSNRFKKTDGNRRNVLTSAVSMSGAVSFDTLAKRALTIYYIDDSFGAADTILRETASCLEKRGASFEAALSPVNYDDIESVYVAGERTLITKTDYHKSAVTVNSKRFVNADAANRRALFRFSEKCMRSLISASLSDLSAAHDVHFELEKIYSASVDFKSMTRSFDKRIKDILPD